MGRKKIEIDWEIVDDLLSKFCEGTEIAASMGIHYQTLERAVRAKHKVAFVEYRRQKRAKGEKILRGLQLQSAMDGNITMQIFLGKQYLGQTDRADHTSDGEKIQPININVVKDENAEKYKKHLAKLAQLN